MYIFFQEQLSSKKLGDFISVTEIVTEDPEQENTTIVQDKLKIQRKNQHCGYK